jgi:hypothetical protein
MRLHQASPPDAEWLAGLLSRQGRKLRTSVLLNDPECLTLHWD